MRYGDRNITPDAPVETVMTRDPKTVRGDEPVQRAAQIMRDEDTGVVPVVEDGDRLVGVVTDRDLVLRVMSENQRADEVRVERVMTKNVKCVHPGDRISDVIEIMRKEQVRRVPVVEQNECLVGIVSMADVATDAPVPAAQIGQAIEDISEDR